MGFARRLDRTVQAPRTSSPDLVADVLAGGYPEMRQRATLEAWVHAELSKARAASTRWMYGEGRNVGRQHLLELAQRTGIDQARAIRVMDQVAHVASTLRSAISAAVVAGKRKAPSGMR